MGIEVYALVVFEIPLDEERKEAEKKLNKRTLELVKGIRDGTFSHPDHNFVGREYVTRRDVLELMEQMGEKIPLYALETEYHFCKLKLVQPPGRGTSQPKPKWEIVEEYSVWSEKEAMMWADNPYVPRRERIEGVTAEQKRWELFFKHPKMSHYTHEDFVELQAFPLYTRIDDRRIQLKQIRFLYPETVKMPLAIALDYVRDRI